MLYFTKKRIIRDQIKSDCLAPFHSLRFEHSGKIIACCFNRGHVLGEFPQMSIKEAWFGEKINDLRKRLSKKDYSLGCQQCEIAVKNGNRINSGAAQYDYLKNYEQHRGYPTMFDFELGSTCNFECIMCSGEYSSAIRKNREKKSKYYAPYEEFSSDFIEQLIPFLPYLKEIRFLGGEPFLMKIYYDIWEKIIEVNPSILISVTTNASVLNSRVKEILSKSNIKVAVSIDSLIKERFEDIRKNGDFETVMSNTAYFHEHNKKLGHVMNFSRF